MDPKDDRVKFLYGIRATSSDGFQTFYEVKILEPAECHYNCSRYVGSKIINLPPSAYSAVSITLEDVIRHRDDRIQILMTESLKKTMRKIRRGGYPEDNKVYFGIHWRLGGKIDKKNMYPYEKQGKTRWKDYIDFYIKLWLAINDGTVIVVVDYDYENKQYPLRPTQFKIYVYFFGQVSCDEKSAREEILEQFFDLLRNYGSKTMPINCVKEEIVIEVLQEASKMAKTSSYEPVEQQPVKQQDQGSGISVWDLVPVVGSVRTIRDGLRDVENGNEISGTLQCLMGIFYLASDVTMVGGAVRSLVKGGAALVTKSVASSAVKTGAGRAVNQAAKEVVKKTGAQRAKQTAWRATKAAAKLAAREAVFKAAKEADKQALAEQAANKTAEEAAKQAAGAAAKEVAKQAAKEAVKQAAVTVAKKATKQAATVVAYSRIFTPNGR